MIKPFPRNTNLKILTVLGARPQFIKAATVSRAIRSINATENTFIDEVIVHTGQHYDSNMSDIFFEQMNIPQPDHKLSFGSLSHGAMTGRMLESIESIILKESPDLVLVYGDTNSTMAGALSAAKVHVPVAHVEAGLRSFNLSMPEEVNRVLTDRVSQILFCPSQNAVNNLEKEGYPFSMPNSKKQQIVDVGDVMYDATLFYSQSATEKISLSRWELDEKNYALCTLHRAENTADPARLKSIFSALQDIAKELPVVLPLHPRTKSSLQKLGQLDWLENLFLLEPIPYLEMQRLEMSAKIILTDSGGMQKEAYFHKVPCITLRDETEWMETIEAGWNQLAGASFDEIIHCFQNSGKPKDESRDIYGDGQAAMKIVRELLK